MTTFCEYCDKFVNTHIKEYSDTIKVKGQDIEITAKGAYCNECGKRLFDRDLDNDALLMAYHKYREINGLLQPEEIKRIRTQYDLSQASFAKLLGFGEKTITRYEGGSLQDEAPNSLIFLMDNPANMIDMLNKYGEKRLTKDETDQALAKAKALMLSELSKYKITSIQFKDHYSIQPSVTQSNGEWREARVECYSR